MGTGIGSIAGSGFASAAGMLADNAKAKETERRFGALMDGVRAGMDKSAGGRGAGTSPAGVASSQISSDPRLPGDFISSFSIENPVAADRDALPSGAAANAGLKGRIDKTSRLYEQSLELESYFVKIMLDSMRKTVQKSSLTGGNDFAGNMYQDMMYDQLSRDMTKNAGFGLADQIYIQLAGKS